MKIINIRGFKRTALPATIYVIIYTLYTVVSALQLSVNLIRPLYMVFYSLTLWYIYKVSQLKGTSMFVRSLSLMFFLVCIYGILLIIKGTKGWPDEFESSSFLMSHFKSVVPLFAFYYFGRQGLLSSSWFRKLFVLFCVDAIGLYVIGQWTMMNHLLDLGVNVDEEITNNSGYAVVTLLPLVAFFNNKRSFQFIAIILILVGTVLCYKRGAIVVGMFSSLFFLYYTLRSQRGSRKLTIIFLCLIASFVLFSYVDNLYLSNDYFYKRVNDDSSDRDSIYSFFWNYLFSEENGIGIIFGNGASATVQLLGKQAHNDWLEYAIDMGLIGVFAFLMLWKTMYSYYRKAKLHLSEEIIVAMGMVIIINFLRTFFSMSFNDMSFFTAAVLGYTMSEVDKLKTLNLLRR